MRKICLIIIFISYPFLQLFSQWQLQNPSPTPYNLNAGYFISASTGWVVGDFGTILKTTDSGLSWLRQEGNITVDLTTVYFLSKLIGFVGGSNKIFKTTNGGSSWESSNWTAFPYSINEIVFLDDSLGYLACGSGPSAYLSITHDQGTTWSYDILYPQILQWIGTLNSITFVAPNSLWAVNTGRKVLKSYDSGNTWRIIEDSSLIFTQNSIAAINIDTAWIVGGDYGTSNRIIKTIDGGKNFSVQLMGNFGYLNSINFFNDSCGVAVGNSGSIFITTNGGENWLDKSLGFSQNLNEVTISASNTCFVIGEKGVILKSTNMGKTWDFIEQGSVNSLKKVIFVNDKIGWVLGGDDFLTTTNGGGSWKKRNYSIWYNTMFFIDDYVGWASSILLNGGGDIYKTEDSGNTWNRISNDTIPQINSLYFINRDTGWAVGGYSWWAHPLPINYGYIYKTTNGGISWRRQDTVLNNILNDVHFADKDNGWIVGNRILMRTTNGGTNWIKVESYNLNSIYFIDSKIGYSVGSKTGNRILKTTDGGINWSEHQLGSYSRDLYSVYFSSYQNGWAVGEKGTICYTTDGGESWNTKLDLTALDLYDVFFINDKIGWITGDNGIILKTEDGGITAVQILKNVKPSGFQLFQNYPNPFNPITTIEYSISSSGLVNIDIYDVLGRKVVALLNEYQNSGIYKKVFDGSLLSSGVYFITLKMANFLQSKKMIIVK